MVESEIAKADVGELAGAEMRPEPVEGQQHDLVPYAGWGSVRVTPGLRSR